MHRSNVKNGFHKKGGLKRAKQIILNTKMKLNSKRYVTNMISKINQFSKSFNKRLS